MAAADRGRRRTLLALAALLALVMCVAGGVWLWVPRHVEPRADFDAARGRADLQTAPQPDLAHYLARKKAELASVGPAEGETGFVRIPIERAMALTSERGLRATGP